jgi:WD40 repeat protein
MPSTHKHWHCQIRVLQFFIIVVAIASGAALSLSHRVSAQTSFARVPLTHETMWLMKRVGAPNPSPDGKWVVFSLVEPAYDDKDQVSDLWIVPADGSAKPRRLTFSKSGESGAAWGPDSQRLAFSAKREGDEVNQIYVLDVSKGDACREQINGACAPSSPAPRGAADG